MKALRSLQKLSQAKYGFNLPGFLPWGRKKETIKATSQKPPGADPFEDAGYLELAKTYLKLGMRENALAQYRILAQHYESSGMEDRALMVSALMARIDSSEPDLENGFTGLKQPLKISRRGPVNHHSEAGAIQESSKNVKGNQPEFDLGAALDVSEFGEARTSKDIESSEQPREYSDIDNKLRAVTSTNSTDSNYNLGLAYLESGLIDDAVQQFRIAYERGENRFEATRILGMCFKEKSMWREAIQAFQTALGVDGISQADMLAVKSQLSLIFKGQGKTEEALKLFREKSAVEEKFPQGAAGVHRNTKKSARK